MTKNPHLLRNYISNLAIEGAKIKNCGKMCSSCAFKKDSPANMEPHNVEAAVQALDHGQFNCHIETGIDSGHPCAGFKNALQVVDPERKLNTYNPKNVVDCPYCAKKHGDKNDKIFKACDRNKKGYTTRKCACGEKFIVLYDFTNRLEAFKITKKRWPKEVF